MFEPGMEILISKCHQLGQCAQDLGLSWDLTQLGEDYAITTYVHHPAMGEDGYFTVILEYDCQDPVGFSVFTIHARTQLSFVPDQRPHFQALCDIHNARCRCGGFYLDTESPTLVYRDLLPEVTVPNYPLQTRFLQDFIREFQIFLQSLQGETA